MRSARKTDSQDRGFTLIELLVVVIIIGILAAIAIPVFLNQRKKAVDASLKSDVVAMAKVQESYIADNPSAPGFAVTMTPAGSTVAVGPNLTFKGSAGNWIHVYVNAGNYVGGYCIQGDSLGSSKGAGSYTTYNSVTGGLQPTTMAGVPGGGTC